MRYTLKHIYKDYQDCYTDDLDKFLHTNIIQEFNIMIMDYILEGKGIFHIDEEQRKVKKNDAIFIDLNQNQTEKKKCEY